ncbi:MAG: helix-turn-helix domain-containing protein, partial [Bacteroidota bacterium]
QLIASQRQDEAVSTYEMALQINPQHEDVALELSDLISDQDPERSAELKHRVSPMLKKPDFALSYIKFIGFQYKKLKNNYHNLLFRDAKTRLLMLLDMLLEDTEQATPHHILPNYLTQKDFAQLICTSRQTVNTLFKELEQDQILRYTQKEIAIIDRQKIKNLVENVK